MCYFPKLIANPKYKPNKKNGYKIPLIKDTRVLYVPIGCQECIECRKAKSKEWQVRLLEDIKEHKNGIFVTLTFNKKSLHELGLKVTAQTHWDRQNKIATLATRLWLERWRKKYKKSVRHWLITELGHEGTERIHLHGIVWTNEDRKQIEKTWNYGYVWSGYEPHGNNPQRVKKINYVNGQTVNYITKYITKIDLDHKGYKAIILTSPGIGNKYTKTWNAQQNKYNHEDTKEYYQATNGYKMALPIYYKNKIYTDQEKEELWIQKINKGIRYIGGIKIDLKKESYNTYFKILKEQKQKAIELGFMTNNKTWKQEKYISEIAQMSKHKINGMEMIEEINKINEREYQYTTAKQEYEDQEMNRRIKEPIQQQQWWE